MLQSLVMREVLVAYLSGQIPHMARVAVNEDCGVLGADILHTTQHDHHMLCRRDYLCPIDKHKKRNGRDKLQDLVICM